MVYRLAAIHLAALPVVLFCRGSLADMPLVIAELSAKRAIAEADSSRASAEHELAAWKLTQLKALRSREHASWQEVARQEVTAKSTAAAADASRRYLALMLEWQARVGKLNLQQIRNESECIRLYMPGSARLVAWVPCETASRVLLERHLEDLRSEYRSLSNIRLSSFQSATTKAARAVEIYSRSENDAGLVRRAEIRLRLAKAEYDCAKSWKEAASILARRIELVNESLRESDGDEQSLSLARPGTPLVDATSDHELARLVEVMARDETRAAAQIAWLKHQLQAVCDRMDALQALSEFRRGDHAELDHVTTEATELQLQIKQAQELLRIQQQIAEAYQAELKSRPALCSTFAVLQRRLRQKNTKVELSAEHSKTMALDDERWAADANAVRHWLELEQLKAQTAADSAAMEAQRDYFVERLKRVEQIPEKARPPKELGHLRHQAQGDEQQLKMMSRQLVLLEREQDRFRHQLNSQRGDQFQLVQMGNGEFMQREPFEVAVALIEAVGFVGQSGLYPEKSIPYPYIESTILFDCLAEPTALAAGRSSKVFDSRGPVASAIGSEIRNPYQAGRCDKTQSSDRYGLRLATHRITYPQDRFCYVPYGLWPVHRAAGWAPCDQLHPASQRGFPTSYPFDREATGLTRLRSFYWRSRCPTFPYRNSYLFQTAFPARSLLYSNPKILATSAYKGFRH